MEQEILPWEYLEPTGSLYSKKPPFLEMGVEYSKLVPWITADKRLGNGLLLSRERDISLKAMTAASRMSTPMMIYCWLWHGRNTNVLKYLSQRDEDE